MIEPIKITLGQIGWDAVSAVSGLLIAALGFRISRSLRRREQQSQRYMLLAEYRKEIIAYSREFFEIVSDALSVRSRSESAGKAIQELDRLSTRLSSLVDTGRFLFPNDIGGSNAFGFEKGPAFAGRRRPALDAILAAHYALEAMKREGDAAKPFLEKALRELRKTNQPLTPPIRRSDPVYLLIQSRRCFLNVVVPDTFPRDWLAMFSTLLGPIEGTESTLD